MSAYPPVGELLPHAPPMVLINDVVEATEGRIVTRVVLRADSPFVESDRVPAVVAIEYMAQTIGAYAGLRARASQQPVRLGYLLGTRELSLDVDAFDVGDELRVEATHVWGDDQLGSFQCTVLRDGRSVARALVNVYQGNEVPPS